ncbi:MAG: transcriptional regulator [Myxococcales bacterium]|nr:transcriptional regulator [Myxococcales bacterium]|tara:strand:+ start:426 stop:1097 length:672 start_codon:yes stop_codon:yes gene_type:complete
MNESVASGTKVIKRYANRKLYDTVQSCYVTLDDIADMIKEGQEIRILDNKSKEDLTAVTFAQIIFEEEKKVAKMPLMLLREIIQNSGDAIGEFLQKKLHDPVNQIRGDVEKHVSVLVRKDKEPTETQPESAAEPETAPPVAPAEAEATEGQDENEAKSVRAFVFSTTEAFDSLQRRIDERVNKYLSAMSHLGQVGRDMDILRARVERLEKRLQTVEGRPKSGN